MRIERKPTPRRRWGFLPARGQELHVSLELPSVEALFDAPAANPFSDHYEAYGDRPALDAIVAEMEADTFPSALSATIEVPAETIQPGLEERTRQAVARYCRVKLAVLDVELRRTSRLGWRTLVIGFVAVFVLNAISRQIEDSTNDLVAAFAQGLSIISWVTLWFPVNLLLYDRWYYRRDQKVYRALSEMAVSVRPSR